MARTSGLMKALIGAGALLALPVMAGAQSATEDHVTVYTVEGAFDDVRLDLVDAIVNRGLVIDYEGMVGDMLNRTAGDVGAEAQVFTRADMLQFCSAVMSRNMVEADPANIGFCPYIIFAYEQPDSEGTIHVGFRRLPEVGSDESQAALAEVNALLDEIVREAAPQ